MSWKAGNIIYREINNSICNDECGLYCKMQNAKVCESLNGSNTQRRDRWPMGQSVW